MCAEVKNRSRQGGIGPARGKDLNKMLRTPRATGGNQRNRNRRSNSRGELAVKACAGAVTVHGGQQNFARAELLSLPRPAQSFFACRGPSAGYIDLGGFRRAR